MKIAAFEHIKKSLQRTKSYAMTKISELSNTTVEALEEMENNKANKTHNHAASDINNGTLPIARGGTGNTTGNAATATKLKTARTLQTNLASTSSASFDGSANITVGVTGTLPIANGGTGATTVAAARNVLGLGNTSGAVPIANGGTGATSVAAARNALGLGNTSGAVPIANGGTGATTANAALTNLGAFPSAGGTITGNITLKGSGNYGNKINFGDGDYVHLYEISDDKLEIKASNLDFVVSGKITKNGADFGSSTMTKTEIYNVLKPSGNGSDNTAFGSSALAQSVSGSLNAAYGAQALSKNTSGTGNTAIGDSALKENVSSNYNTALGFSALEFLTAYTNCTGLGYDSAVTGSNQVQLGNTSVTVYAQKALVTRSDARDKLDIEDSPLGLNFIMKLRPRKYRMNSREAYFERGKRDFSAPNDGSKAGKRPHYGLVAQEVKYAMNELDVDFAGYLDSKIDGGEDILSLGYTEFIAPMIKAIQEQQQLIEQLQKEIVLLKG